MSRRTQLFEGVYDRLDDRLEGIPSRSSNTPLLYSVEEEPQRQQVELFLKTDNENESVRSLPQSLSLQRATVVTEPSSSQQLQNVRSIIRPFVVTLEKRSPWENLQQLGCVVVEDEIQFLCTKKKSKSHQVMLLKERDMEVGRREFHILSSISHPGIIRLRQAYQHNNKIYLGFDEYHVSLSDILRSQSHLKLQELHIQIIAQTVSFRQSATLAEHHIFPFHNPEITDMSMLQVFRVLKHLAELQFSHNQIHPKIVRFCQRGEQVLIGVSNFAYAKSSIRSDDLDEDLRNFTRLLLVCINNHLGNSDEFEDIEILPSKYAVPESWKTAAQLNKLLNDLLDLRKTSSQILNTQYDYLDISRVSASCFIPHLRVAELLCDTPFAPPDITTEFHYSED